MKKLLLIFLAFSILVTPVFARTRLLVASPVYKGTITGLRISAPGDGVHDFIDNANASVTALADGNHEIYIYDSANRFIKGVLKAAGTSEGLGSELLLNPSFDTNTTNWTPVNSTLASIAGGQSGNCLEITSGAITGQATGAGNNSTVGALYYLGAYLKDGTTAGGLCQIQGLGGTIYVFQNVTSTSSWVAKFVYKTGKSTNSSMLLLKNNSTAGTVLFDEASVKQVLTPSSSGATIVNSKGGTMYNFSYKNASFLYNAASYYVIIRAIR